MNFDERVKLSPFEGETTQKNDYRVPPLEPYVKYRWPSERVERGVLPPPRPQQFTCSETLTKLRGDRYVPMNLMWKPRPIIDPLPSTCDVPSKRVDRYKEEVIRTRPRVYMGAAVSIDDVDEPEVRNLLLEYMYHTESQRCMKETQDYIQRQKEENKAKAEECKDVPKRAIPCAVKNDGVMFTKDTTNLSIIPKVDEIIHTNYESWDKKQKRAIVDPTVNYWERFYRNRTPDKPLSSLIPTETIDRLTHLIETDKLRLPHDKGPCVYDGYMPDMTTIGVQKIELPMEHPWHTTNDTVYVNHWDHANNNYEK